MGKVIGERVRERRRHAGLTQAELGEALGLSRTAVTNIEAGKQSITVEALLGAARRCRCDIADLLPDIADLLPESAKRSHKPFVLGVELAERLPDIADLLPESAKRSHKPFVLGVELAERLPDGWQAQGVIVLVRAIDGDGRRRITHLEGGDVMLWEGMAMIDVAKRSFGARLDALTECVEQAPVSDR